MLSFCSAVTNRKTQLLEANQPKVAVNYVARCDAKQRVDLYVRCGDWGRAALECKERNDKQRLEWVLTLSTCILLTPPDS